MKIPTLILCVLLLSIAATGQGIPPANVKLGAVKKETVHPQVTGVATVDPWLRTVLSAEIVGLVESYPLREGDEVVAGKTVVCELKKTTLRIDLAEAEALLARARAESATSVKTAEATVEEMKALRDQADREFARAKNLFEEQVITQAELDRSESEAVAARSRYERARKDLDLAKQGADPASKALEAEVRRAQARLDRVKDQIEKTRIVSPVSGRVVRRLTEIGGWLNPGSPVIEVLTLDPVLVRLNVNEKDIAKIEIGNPADVTVDGYPGRTFPGTVRFLVPEADVKTRSFPVLIEVPNADGALLAGMFARVSVAAGEGVEGLTVPKDAVVEGAMGSIVYTLGEPTEVDLGGHRMKLPTAKIVPVKKGLSSGGRIVVTGPGLAPGVPVVTTGNEMLAPGQPLIPPRPAPGGGGGKGPPNEGGGDRR